jgi:membrane associated rhomboid family serine protease
VIFLLPLGTDNPIRSRPYVNIALVAANVAVFLAVDVLGNASPVMREWKFDMMLWAESPRWYQFFTSMFLHGGWAHLIGNMIFLWAFGNSLNQKMGCAAYLRFYLAAGGCGGIGY